MKTEIFKTFWKYHFEILWKFWNLMKILNFFEIFEIFWKFLIFFLIRVLFSGSAKFGSGVCYYGRGCCYDLIPTPRKAIEECQMPIKVCFCSQKPMSPPVPQTVVKGKKSI